MEFSALKFDVFFGEIEIKCSGFRVYKMVNSCGKVNYTLHKFDNSQLDLRSCLENSYHDDVFTQVSI